MQDRADGIGHIVAREGAASRQHFVEHRAKGPNVTPLIGFPSAGLLGTHVCGRAQNHTAPHQRRAGEGRGRRAVSVDGNILLTDLRKAEVPQLHHAIRSELDVRRLQIAVDDPSLVRRFQGIRDLSRDRQYLLDRDRSFCHAIRKGWPVDEFQYERVNPVRFLEPMDRGDVRMIERGEDLRLPSEASDPIVV
jgi:hypothetical protein